MESPSTCGQGLAYHGALPGKLADVFAAISENLEIHVTALDPTERGSRPEFDAYIALATEHREIESRLRALAVQMEGYRNLPMAVHDPAVMTSPNTAEALERMVHEEEALAALLQEHLRQYRQMLNAGNR